MAGRYFSIQIVWVSSISITPEQRGGFHEYIRTCVRTILVLSGVPALLMNVIIFIIRVLKLLFMQKKYIFLALVFIMAVVSPAAGSLTKISAGAPVYLGEQNLDISSGLQGCRVIAWWENGTELTDPPAKNITIIRSVEDSGSAFRYSIDPGLYAGSTGTWYCEDRKPLRAVFEVLRPEIAVRFWDLDRNEDVTGKTVPLNANITYRIDTNLDRALQYTFRPDITPLDSFYTVTLTNPRGKGLSSIYTGSYGKPDTAIISFESSPFISASPYFWKDGSAWNRESRNVQGDFLYPPGTYTVSVTQNLNDMEEMYAPGSSETLAGLTRASATVTFIKPESTAVQTVSAPGGTPSGVVTTPPADTPPSTTVPSPGRTPIPAKTTYAPLPSWIVLIGLGIAGACAGWQRNY
jgi:hypothetical protein